MADVLVLNNLGGGQSVQVDQLPLPGHTVKGYNYGCRCRACTAAKSDYMRRRRPPVRRTRRRARMTARAMDGRRIRRTSCPCRPNVRTATVSPGPPAGRSKSQAGQRNRRDRRGLCDELRDTPQGRPPDRQAT